MKILKFCWWRRKLYWGLHTVLPTVFLNPNITPTDRYRILFPLHIFYWRDPLHAVLFYTVYLPVLYCVSRGTHSETLVETLVYRLNVFSQSASFDFFHVQTLKERCVLNSLVYWCVAFPIPVSFVYCGPPCMRIVSVSMYWIVKVYWFPYGPCFFFQRFELVTFYPQVNCCRPLCC